MMPLALPILADHEGIPVRLIGVVLILILWGISALSNAMGKAKKQAQQRRLQQQPRPIARGGPAPRPMGTPPSVPRTTGGLPPLPTLMRPPALPPAVPAVPRPRPQPVVSRTTAAKAARPAATPAQIAPLLNARTIRAQFILAEVFRPPLSLRKPKP